MDFISHAFLGSALVADKKLLLPALFFGAGPDLINGIPVHFATAWRLKNEGKTWREIFRIFTDLYAWKKTPAWTHTLYLHMHSLWFAFFS